MFCSICEMSYVVILGVLSCCCMLMQCIVFFLNLKSKEVVYLTIIYSCKEYV